MIKIDSEFHDLIPPLTEEEYIGLRDSILKEGCRDALVLWNDVLIDGHNRYEICSNYNIPFSTVQRDFENRDAVIEWIILNQFGRRNLPAHERARLALRLKPVFAAKAKKNQRGGQGGVLLSQNSVKANPVNTQKEIAKVSGVSHDTIAKVEKIEQEAPESVIMASRKGEISVNTAYQVTKLEPEEQKEIADRIEHIEDEPEETNSPKEIVREVLKRPHVSFNSGNNEWYTPQDVIDSVRNVLGKIDLDPASSEQANTVVCADKYYTVEINGLNQKWFGNVWLNPPYGTEIVGKFVDKLIEELPHISQAIILVNNATETEWFGKLVIPAQAICFPRGRIKYWMPGEKTGSPLQGQAILYYGNNAEKFICEFQTKGWCVIPK